MGKHIDTGGVQAAIFDLDGTLLDSMGVWLKVDVDFLTARSLPVPPGYSDAICARSFRDAAVYTIDLFGFTQTPEEIMDEWYGMAREEYTHHVHLKPGAGGYLTYLKEKGVKLAVASGLARTLMEPCLKNNGVWELFDVVCSTDDVGPGKERPDIFFHTAKKLGIPPAACLVFEDIPEAVKSAKQAGMRVVAVYDNANAKRWEEIQAAADATITSFTEAPRSF